MCMAAGALELVALLRFSDSQLAGRMGSSPWVPGGSRYGEHARLAELQGFYHRAAANIAEKGVLRGFEPDKPSADVQQIEQVVVERPGPAGGVYLVQRGRSRTSARVLETVPDPLIDYSHSAHTLSPDCGWYWSNPAATADAYGLSLLVVLDRVGHLLDRIRDGAYDSRAVVFRRLRSGQFIRRGIGVSCGERVQQDYVAAQGDRSVPRGSKNKPLSTALAPRICATRIRIERSHSYTR